MFAQVVFQELEVSLCPVRTRAREDWLGPPTLQLGKRECPLSGLLMSEAPKLSSQNMLMPPFSKHMSHEESCSLVVPVQKDDYLTFFFFSHLSPYSPSFIPYISQALHLQEGRYEICSSVSSLGCLINKLYLPHISGSAFGWLHNKQRTRWVPMFVNSRKIENGQHEQRIQYIIWQADHEVDLLKEL